MNQAKAFAEFDRVCDVIDSCVTSRQNMVAYRMVQLFDRKWPQYAMLIAYLYDEVDDNLSTIVSKPRP